VCALTKAHSLPGESPGWSTVAPTSRARSREVLDESRMREIRTSGSTGGGLETESRQILHGHERGNPGY
jgi:hypothetical protein